MGGYFIGKWRGDAYYIKVDNWVKKNIKKDFFNDGNTVTFNGKKINGIDEITV